jgi:hypothetical protein
MSKLDEEIRELCLKRGVTFRPWEVTPSEVHRGPCPGNPGTAAYETWPSAQRLRRQLIAELRARSKPEKGN